MRGCPVVSPDDSLLRAARVLRDCPFGIVPVVDSEGLVGTVTEAALVTGFAGGMSPSDAVARLMGDAVPVIHAYESGAAALRTMERLGVAELIVVDESGRALGVVGASSLYPDSGTTKRPPLVGGMATPFGVYLTTGAIRAGKGGFALMATGALLFVLFAAGVFATEAVLPLLPWKLTTEATLWLQNAVPFALFLIGMRVLPISGIHAAEHKVVHAIERGEPLVPEVVRRMPRVHPRCGTNIAVGASVFMGLADSTWIPNTQIRILTAAVATMIVWRPLGHLVQRLITTKPPSERQIQMGIESGMDLLEKYRTWTGKPPNFLERLYSSGLFHVIGGSFAAYGAIYLVARLLGFELPVSV
jgi:CBS domain-containing protein